MVDWEDGGVACEYAEDVDVVRTSGKAAGVARGSRDAIIELFDDKPTDLSITEDAGIDIADEAFICVSAAVWTASALLSVRPGFAARSADESAVSLFSLAPSRHTFSHS